MTNVKNRKEETVINSCILRSRDIALLLAAKISNRNTQFFTLRTLRSLQSDGYIKEIEKELNQLIDDHKLSIARLLNTLFMQHKIPFKVQKNGKALYWFSSHDLSNGYVILYHIVRKDTATHVLFLTDLENNPFFSGQIKAGEIYPYPDVAHLLDEVKPAWNNQTVIQKVNKKLKSCKINY